MKVRRTSLVLSVCTAPAAVAIGVPVGSAAASGPAEEHAHDDTYSFAVIGDIPYGPAQIADFPNVVRQINADPQVRFVDHLGDIKDGSSVCSDGSTGVDDYLRVTINPSDPEVLSWTRVPFAS